VATAPGAFRPLFQTDRFDWPEPCRVLDADAQQQFDRLADALEAALQQGRKVVGLCGLRPGAGCTTLLLCAARRLAGRGWKVVMVDADVDDPQLDPRLGLAPEAGWQDVAAGRAALAEAVIESVEDRLAVLPSGAGGADRRAGWDDGPFVTASLEVLRDSYDLVLVDLGPLEAAASSEDFPAQTAAGAVDAAVLVYDVRSTSPEKLAGLQDRLTAAGIAQAGLVENFVPAGETTERSGCVETTSAGRA
jgi:MinD-like ATPase involved in chromosome partitioning or flagellar assembly